MVYITVLLRLVLPFVYCVLICGIYSYITHRSFADSLAPCFFLQIILMIVTGMLGSVNAGIYAAVAAALTCGIIVFLRRNRIPAAGDPDGNGVRITSVRLVDSLRAGMIRLFSDQGFILFVIVYLLIWALNYGKCFRTGDEFSHWGPFLRETLRIDRLYCTSPQPIVHKTYFPGITLFEALWCRLSLGYSDANAYRGIQMLAASMMLPMVMKCDDESKGRLRLPAIIFRATIVFGLPLFFGYDFYHTIYQDLIFGVIIAYCMWLVLTGGKGSYNVFVLSISMFIMINAKMTAVAFVPMIVLFYLVYTHTHVIRRAVTLLGVPLLMMVLLNKYITAYAPPMDLSFSVLSFDLIWGLITHNGIVPMQADVEKAYMIKLFREPVMGNIALDEVIMILLAIVCVWAYKQPDKEKRYTILLTGLWVLLAGIAYIILMYFMYMTMFCEREAREIASYSRYMGSYTLAVVLIVISLWQYYLKRIDLLPLVLANIVLAGNYMMFGLLGIDQIFPGPVDMGALVSEDRIENEDLIRYFETNTGDDATVYVVNRGYKGGDPGVLRYYLSPRVITDTSPGPKTEEYEEWSSDMSPAAFEKDVSRYEHIYFMYTDEAFREKYLQIFADPDEIEDGDLYRVVPEGDKIALVREDY